MMFAMLAAAVAVPEVEEKSFTVNRPGKRPEFWTEEEWRTAAMNGDWKRRSSMVEHHYQLARRQVFSREFELAHRQRAQETRVAYILAHPEEFLDAPEARQ